MIATERETEAPARAALDRFLTWGPEAQAAAFAEWGTPPPVGHFLVGPALTAGSGRVFFLLWDSFDPPGSRFPYRALLQRRADGTWAIRTIQSQCASCFGTGLVDGESRLCDTCLAEGWGGVAGRETLVPVPV
jgi:hypothetical protein